MNEHEIVEVVLTKEMTMGDYKRIFEASKQKGWRIQAFQTGVHSHGYKKEITCQKS